MAATGVSVFLTAVFPMLSTLFLMHSSHTKKCWINELNRSINNWFCLFILWRLLTPELLNLVSSFSCPTFTETTLMIIAEDLYSSQGHLVRWFFYILLHCDSIPSSYVSNISSRKICKFSHNFTSFFNSRDFCF